MSNRVSISLLIGWFIILFIFLLNGWTPSPKQTQYADGVTMAKTENQHDSESSAENSKSSHCKAFGPNTNYKQTGISLRTSETRNAVTQ